MDIDKILKDDLIVENLNTDSKLDALTKLSTLLEEKGFVTEGNKFLEDILYRETLGTTGIGNYIAIPHGKSTYVNETTIVIAKLNHEIEWESLDGKGVKVIILFVVKNNSDFEDNHLKLLSEVASCLADENVLQKLLESNTKKEIKDCFKS